MNQDDKGHGHGHGHSHGHGHGHGYNDISEKKLLFVSLLNLIITIAEFIGGFISNSLALLSDAVHNLGDTFAIILAYIANKISKRSANERKTFGYKRIEILAALLNAVVLIVIIVFLFREAWHRFQNPEPIKGLVMFIVATIGLMANLFSVYLLRGDSGKNINIRAAYLHLLGDTISSVAVIIGSILIYFFEVFWIDPIITVIIGVYILKETIVVLKQAVDILMQATPKSIDLAKIKIELEEISGIDNIHHVHIWNLNDSQIHFECHADIHTDLKISETNVILSKMEEILKNKFKINHVTVQFEHFYCDKKELIHL